jgi:hypothetical protein
VVLEALVSLEFFDLVPVLTFVEEVIEIEEGTEIVEVFELSLQNVFVLLLRWILNCSFNIINRQFVFK